MIKRFKISFCQKISFLFFLIFYQERIDKPTNLEELSRCRSLQHISFRYCVKRQPSPHHWIEQIIALNLATALKQI